MMIRARGRAPSKEPDAQRNVAEVAVAVAVVARGGNRDSII